MMFKKNTTFLTICFLIIIVSCKTKQASCPSFDIEENEKASEKKKNSKYEIVILKDGKRINRKKKKRRKNPLFKKKVIK